MHTHSDPLTNKHIYLADKFPIHFSHTFSWYSSKDWNQRFLFTCFVDLSVSRSLRFRRYNIWTCKLVSKLANGFLMWRHTQKKLITYTHITRVSSATLSPRAWRWRHFLGSHSHWPAFILNHVHILARADKLLSTQKPCQKVSASAHLLKKIGGKIHISPFF